jgi:hypothetical protein
LENTLELEFSRIPQITPVILRPNDGSFDLSFGLGRTTILPKLYRPANLGACRGLRAAGSGLRLSGIYGSVNGHDPMCGGENLAANLSI